jgi:hypothetical protein
MNIDESIVFNFLQRNYGSNVVYEPDGSRPPDFLLNSKIAIEARRLNQQFFSKNKTEGLETLSYQIYGALNDVLLSFVEKLFGYFSNIKDLVNLALRI